MNLKYIDRTVNKWFFYYLTLYCQYFCDTERNYHIALNAIDKPMVHKEASLFYNFLDLPDKCFK
jgi:hypothetical protein